MLLLVLSVAALLRFWQLGDAPPGLYRDEAYNGLDALRVLQGEHALYFATNNGREPTYIYLTAASIALLGRSALAVRFAAAVVGTVTTYVVYRLARSWFGQRSGLLAAWLWAVTLWPVHLSRIGLRAVLLAPVLALAFWLGTVAFRRNRRWLWLVAGALYGATFYTYLAARFTPILLILLLSYLFLTRLKSDAERRRLISGLLLFGVGALLALLPLGVVAWQQPDIVLGRAGQVSILSPEINEGDLWGTLLRQSGQALGLFIWRGDTIARHNPPGRPLFDFYMVLPFAIGLLWLVRQWRRPAAMFTLLWVAVMLGPTILAEDTPHFLRASGILPAALFLPAVGLSKLWEWPKLPGALRQSLVLLLVWGTLISTITDYTEYTGRPETAYLFEAAARELAQEINAERSEVTVFADRRFWEGWPSLPFLVQRSGVNLYTSEDELHPEPVLPVSIYAWPYGRLDFIPEQLPTPAAVFIEEGALARGDLEPSAYPLYVRYSATSYTSTPITAYFGENIVLHEVAVMPQPSGDLEVDLQWSLTSVAATSPATLEIAPISFVHVLDGGAIAGQRDVPLGEGYWPVSAWREGQVVRNRYIIELNEPYDRTRHQIVVGLYDAETTARLPVFTPEGEPAGDSWLIE